MEIVHKGRGSDLISVAPKPPTYLSSKAKKHYYNLAKILIAAGVLKERHLPTLEILADSKAQYEFALREINRKNKEKRGTGFIQTFKSNASQISAEITLKEKAVKSMIQCIRLFGLDPKSEKELNQEPANQLDLLKELGLTKSS